MCIRDRLHANWVTFRQLLNKYTEVIVSRVKFYSSSNNSQMLRVSQQEQLPGKGYTQETVDLRHFSLVCIFTIDNYQLARLCNDVRVQINQSCGS